MSGAGCELVKRVALERFLSKPAEEVERMVEEDGLPCLRVPGRHKPGKRFFLPDVHEWLVSRCVGEGTRMRDYGEFRRAFFGAQGAGRARIQSPETRIQKD